MIRQFSNHAWVFGIYRKSFSFCVPWKILVTLSWFFESWSILCNRIGNFETTTHSENPVNPRHFLESFGDSWIIEISSNSCLVRHLHSSLLQILRKCKNRWTQNQATRLLFCAKDYTLFIYKQVVYKKVVLFCTRK